MHKRESKLRLNKTGGGGVSLQGLRTHRQLGSATRPFPTRTEISSRLKRSSVTRALPHACTAPKCGPGWVSRAGSTASFHADGLHAKRCPGCAILRYPRCEPRRCHLPSSGWTRDGFQRVCPGKDCSRLTWASLCCDDKYPETLSGLKLQRFFLVRAVRSPWVDGGVLLLVAIGNPGRGGAARAGRRRPDKEPGRGHATLHTAARNAGHGRSTAEARQPSRQAGPPQDGDARSSRRMGMHDPPQDGDARSSPGRGCTILPRMGMHDPPQNGDARSSHRAVHGILETV